MKDGLVVLNKGGIKDFKESSIISATYGDGKNPK